MATLIEEKLRDRALPITEIEQSAFCQSLPQLKSDTLEAEFRAGVRWQRIPPEYLRIEPAELSARIRAAKARLSDRLLILGHHYQRDDVIEFADFRGDSFNLSRQATEREDVEYIVFCGVHFMAETADVLTGRDVSVILPNMTAGCSMADMAQLDDVLDCWDDLSEVLGAYGGVIPITYMNSTAGIKALCGANGGIVCTSSNAPATFRWALERGERILFLPDQHLGRNTATRSGIGLDEMLVWDPYRPLGGHSPDALRRARIILWKGHCSVHTRFTVEQIAYARERDPKVKILVHPECTKDVVDAADFNGSTEFILRTIGESPPGSVWGVGTEISMVNRLASEHPDKTIFCLDPVVCPCSTMYRIHPAYLLWVLDGLNEGVIVNQIRVDDETRAHARIALDRMLSVV